MASNSFPKEKDWEQAWLRFDGAEAAAPRLDPYRASLAGDAQDLETSDMTETSTHIPAEVTSVTDATKTGVRRTVANSGAIFALFGAIASIVTVYGFFSKDEPVLKAEAHFSESFIPDNSKVSFDQNEATVWRFGSDLILARYCKKKTGEGRINYFYDMNNCKSAESAVKKITQSAKFSEDNIQRITLAISNNGSDVASNIKLRPVADGHVRVLDQAENVILERPVSTGETVALPSLNPSESLNVTLDSRTNKFSTIDPDLIVPKITHSRGSASISRYRNVSPFFGNIADMLDGIPKALILVIFVGVSFFVTAAIVLIISSVDALLRGKPLSTILQQPSNGKT